MKNSTATRARISLGTGKPKTATSSGMSRQLDRARHDAARARARAEKVEAELGALRSQLSPTYLRGLAALAASVRTEMADLEIETGDRFGLVLRLMAAEDENAQREIGHAEMKVDERVRSHRGDMLRMVRALEKKLSVAATVVEHPVTCAKIRRDLSGA